MYMYTQLTKYMYIHNYTCNGMETASHAGHCLINLVNVRESETELYTKYIGSRTRVMKIGQNVQQLAHYFHIPIHVHVA